MAWLVACEHSGKVREALVALGHEAASCDILDTAIKPNGKTSMHYKGDVRKILGMGWEGLIAFPPCTHLAVSGAKHFEAKRKDGRQQEGIDLFMALAGAPIPFIAIENPIGIMSTVWRKPDQIVQPYMFGDPFTKTTCLWLKGLPLLTPTKVVDKGEFHVMANGKRMPKWYYDAWGKGKDRGKIRGVTFPGFAEAMARQWGHIPEH